MKKKKKQLLKSSFSSNVSVLRTSFFMANHIAKVKKPFNIGKEMILLAAKDICHERLGEAAVQKVACVPLLAGTITRQVDEIEEDIEAQLERINGSLSYTILVGESTNADKKAIMFVFV